MGSKKEPVEIKCSECGTHFRLWIPSDKMAEWEKGSRVSCIRCGAQHLLKKTGSAYEVKRLLEEKPAPKPAPKVEAPKPRPEPIRMPEPQHVPPVAAHAPVIEPLTPEASNAKDTVLLIEDDRLSREMVDHTLRDAGIRLVAVKNATEAIRVLRREHVHLIVTDLYLKNPADPESSMDGEELLKKILDSGLNIPAIITTGKDIIDDLVLDPKWFDLHVKGFIQKGNPFWAEELKFKIKEVLYKD